MSKKLTPAQKATRTRLARVAFRTQYGTRAFNVVRDILAGRSTDEIVTRNNIWHEQVDAYRANLTRGTYSKALRGCKL